MPIFEYRCSACHHLEEVLQKHSDPGPAVCPECGKKGTLAKEMSATSFQLKGGGWYKDLYASTSKTDTTASGGGSASSSVAKSETKAETKSETKAETKSETKAETKSEPKAEKAPKKDSSGGSSSGGTSSGGSTSSAA